MHTLVHEVASGSLAHAYLFSGPRGVGKTTIARILAKAVNCTKRKTGESEPCNACSLCTSIDDGSSVDVVEIDAASHTSVDHVREVIIEHIRFAPHHAQYKVFIIDEVHMLSTSAFNALLKTLEEPPAHALFVLATTELHKVPDTIVSRCQRFDFTRVRGEAIAGMLQSIARKEKRSVDKEVIAAVAEQSGGFVRDALSLFDQILSLSSGKITWNDAEKVLPRAHENEVALLAEALFDRDASRALQIVHTAMEKGRDLEAMTQALLKHIRLVFLAAAGGDEDEVLRAKGDRAGGALEVARMLQEIADALAAMRHAPLVQLPLEIAIAEICLQDSVSNISSGGEGSSLPPEKAQGKKEEEDSQSSAELPARSQKNNTALSLETIQKKWKAWQEEIKEQSLRVLMEGLFPLRVEGRRIVIGCEYTFHKQRLEEIKVRQQLESVLSQFLGEEVEVGAEIVEGDIAKKMAMRYLQQEEGKGGKGGESDNKVIRRLLEDFGGTVIE